jgi:hypothetical protein
MRFIILLLLHVALFSFDIKYHDNTPKFINKKDLEVVKNIDNLAYNLAIKPIKKVNIMKIYSFLKRTKNKEFEYSKVKITTDFKTGYGRGDLLSEDKYYKAYLTISYDIFDPKTDKEINNKKIDYNLNLLTKVREYSKAYITCKEEKQKLEFLEVKQHLLKAEYKTAIKYRDDYLKLLNDLQEQKFKVYEAETLLNYHEELLLSLTKEKEKLRELLR